MPTNQSVADRMPSLISAMLCLALMSCGGSSSSEPPTQAPAEPVDGIVFDSSGQLAMHQATLTSLIETTLAQTKQALPVGQMRIDVTADASRSIPGWGVGGYALGPNQIEVVVDPNFATLSQILPDRVPHIVAHEIHHAVRWRSPGPYDTLFEALVFEGLADLFAAELLGTPLPPWADAFPEEETAAYLDRARDEFDSSFDFEAWFFGVGTDLPRWTGYTLGYRIVRDYVDSNPGTSAASLVDTPADEFRVVVDAPL